MSNDNNSDQEKCNSEYREQIIKSDFKNMESKFLELGHLIKYNLYLLSKSIIFSSLISRLDVEPKSIETAIDIAHSVLRRFHDKDHEEYIKENVLNKE